MKLKYFAGVHDKIGIKEEEVSPTPKNVTILKEWLIEKHPELKESLPQIRIAVNLEFVSKDHPLQDNDEVALIPPVSGG